MFNLPEDINTKSILTSLMDHFQTQKMTYQSMSPEEKKNDSQFHKNTQLWVDSQGGYDQLIETIRQYRNNLDKED